jgi:hypothetical protein
VVAAGAGLVVVPSLDDAGPLDAIATVVVLLDGAALPEAVAAGRPLLAALTVLCESPPQAPSPRTATVASAAMCRMVDVPTTRFYGFRSRWDCLRSVQSSNP